MPQQFKIFPHIIEALQNFWQKHPGLLYGLSALLGVFFALEQNLIVLIPLVVIAIPLLLPSSSGGLGRRCLLALFFALCFFGYVHSKYNLPNLPPEGVFGKGYLKIDSVTHSSTHFGKRWIYKGTLSTFTSLHQQPFVEAKNIPITISLQATDDIMRPSADRDYIVEGKLRQAAANRYQLNIKKDTPWYPVDGTWNFSEYRFNIKQAASNYIRQHIPDQRSANFLVGIATGDFDDRLMQFEFSRFGLQHIMAISGFHFAIIASILSLALRVIVSKRKAHIILIFLLSSYFLFLGFGPSVMRAWITVSIVLIGFLLEKRGAALNSLGLAMLVILMIDPLMSHHIGFQFSFVTTAAILVLYPVAELLLQQILTKRPLSQVVEMDTLNQHAYCLVTYLRQALALTIAVNLIALPMMLYYFQKFPVLSLLYNLFFPFLVSIAMLLLIVAIVGTVFFPPLGDFLHAMNNQFTLFVLNFTYNLPTSFDVVWRVTEFSVESIVVYLCVVFCGALVAKHILDERKLLQDDFAFT